MTVESSYTIVLKGTLLCPEYFFLLVLGQKTMADRQTDNIYIFYLFCTMIVKAMQLMGPCINTKSKNNIYT